MPERETRSVRVDPDVWSDFVEQVIEWEGQKHGELGRHVENALEEYVDNDRLDRVEAKVDTLLEQSDGTHTHKATPTEGKVQSIATRLTAMDALVIPKADVNDVIGTVAGHDPRTLDKYKELLKQKGLAYRHPTSAVWTTDVEQWTDWATDYLANNPTVTIREAVEDYPMGIDEVEREMTAVEP